MESKLGSVRETTLIIEEATKGVEEVLLREREERARERRYVPP